MIWDRILVAIGSMAFAYIIYAITLDLAKNLELSGKHTFLVKILVFINFFSAMTSLFVGLFMHYHIEHQTDLCRRETSDKFDEERADLQQQIKAISKEVDDLRSRLYHEKRNTDERSREKGHTQGYVNGYAVGFEDCMDVLDIPQERKMALLHMARTSGVHRIKTRPSIFHEQKAVEADGVLH